MSTAHGLKPEILFGDHEIPERAADGPTSGEMLMLAMSRFKVTALQALEIVEWAQDNFGAPRSVAVQVSEMDAVRDVNQKYRLAFLFMASHSSGHYAAAAREKKRAGEEEGEELKHLKEVLMMIRCVAMELGINEAAGIVGDSSGDVGTSKLAKVCHMSKQAVLKCSDLYRGKLQLPLRPGQRTKAQRKRMKQAMTESWQKESE